MKRVILWAPLAIFLLFAIMFLGGLIKPENRAIRSQLIGKPLPEFTLQPALGEGEGLSTAHFRTGEPKLLNIFASWCIPCAAEAPQLLQLAREGVTIEAVALRDRPEDIRAFLARHGNPYSRIGGDTTSSVQIALGSSGVPETFVVDGRGIIRHQHIGDIRPEDVPAILRKVEEAR